MNALTIEHAQLIVSTVASGHRLLSLTPATAAFTNSVHILRCLSPVGTEVRLVVKRLTDGPDPERATADFHGLRIARKHGIPAPEPLYLDSSGELLGIPGIVSGFVEGAQVANPEDVRGWAVEMARILLRVHEIIPDEHGRRHIYNGRDMGLYFLSGQWPEKMAPHPLAAPIFEAIHALRTEIRRTRAALLHMDYWPGNVLWHHGRISALLDWDAASYGDPALDVAYFRMNMYLRGIKQAADMFLDFYEAEAGPVENLGFWELACAARPLPTPALWIPASREMGDLGATDDRADTDFCEFVESASRRAYARR